MIDVEKLRRDYMTAATWLVDCGEWTVAESHEVGLAIKTALYQQDTGYLAFWAEWLAGYAELARRHQAELDRLNREAVAYVTQQRLCAL